MENKHIFSFHNCGGWTKGAGIFFGRGWVPKYTGGHKFLVFGKKNRVGYKIFDDQNVGSHKMTTDSVFILFKKTNLNIILVWS